MGPVGVPEMFFIFILALLLFGPKKLPELGRMLGKGLSEFRRAKNELKSTFETHMRELERETQVDSSSSLSSTDYSSRPYPYPYDEYGQSENGYGSEPVETAPPNSYEAAMEAQERAEADSPASVEEVHAERAGAHPPDSTMEHEPVSGTVPRSNGTRPHDPVPVSAQEEHRG